MGPVSMEQRIEEKYSGEHFLPNTRCISHTHARTQKDTVLLFCNMHYLIKHMCHNSTDSSVYIPHQSDDTEIAHFGVTNLKLWLTNCHANDYL